MRRYMPAEWEEHKGTWLAWPHNQSQWPGLDLDIIRRTYAEIIRALLSAEEKVSLCVNDAAQLEVRDFLEREKLPAEGILFFRIPTDSSWVRNYGPIFIRTSVGLWMTDWVFDGRGEEYPPWDQDNEVPEKIAGKLSRVIRMPRIRMDNITLGGGAIDVNGEGMMITTEGLLSRNSGLKRGNLEYSFKEYLGISKTIWLPGEISGDHTGRVDNIARFVSSRRVVVALESKLGDENHSALRKNFSLLVNEDLGLEVVSIPMPEPIFYREQRLPASYLNFYIANKAVLVPTFRSRRDAAALKLLQKEFPGRQVVGIDCVDLLRGAGAIGTIHCSTLQHPTP